MALSALEKLRAAHPEERKAIIKRLTEAQAREMLARPWWLVARPEQLAPQGDWTVWLIMAGRGWGKTRACAEWLIDAAIENPTGPDGAPTEWAVVADTFREARTVCVEGPSGLLRVLARRGLPMGPGGWSYNRSSWQIVLADRQRIHLLGADNADVGRGLNLAGLWADEVAKWGTPYATWYEGLAPALRVGRRPRAVVATTPRPSKLLTEWSARVDGSVHLTRGSTFDNASNLSPAALSELRARYANTRLGRQELYGELLDESPGALWTRNIIESAQAQRAPEMARIVVAVDPAVSAGEDSNETGIIVAGLGVDGRGYVLEDASVRATPDAWARRVVSAFHRWKADRVVAETNQGGDIIEVILRSIDGEIPYRSVSATRGKGARAEPVAALYEQGRISHVGNFATLEDQMVTWEPGGSYTSPDRIDALVWALTDLMLRGEWAVL